MIFKNTLKIVIITFNFVDQFRGLFVLFFDKTIKLIRKWLEFLNFSILKFHFKNARWPLLIYFLVLQKLLLVSGRHRLWHIKTFEKSFSFFVSKRLGSEWLFVVFWDLINFHHLVITFIFLTRSEIYMHVIIHLFHISFKVKWRIFLWFLRRILALLITFRIVFFALNVLHVDVRRIVWVFWSA